VKPLVSCPTDARSVGPGTPCRGAYLEVAEVLRRKTPGERMEMVGELWRTARIWIESAVRWQLPDWDDEQMLAEVRGGMSGGPVTPPDR